jgi:DNA-binding transcriptional LysR family regulator
MRHLDNDALATFVAVVDCGGFTAAAEKLGKTQAAVSVIIARLEQRIGKRLLDRSRRGVSLTDTGQILISYARRIRALEDEALSAVSGYIAEGRLRLGMPDDYLEVFGAPVIDRFVAANPKVQVEILGDFSYRLETMLESGEIDIAIITRAPAQTRGEFLRTEQQVWCAAAGSGRPERQEVLPLAVFPEGCRARPHILKALDQAGRAWRIVYTSTHLLGVQSMVAKGLAVTVLPTSVVPKDWRRLGTTDGLPPLPPLEIALLMPEAARPAARRLASFLRSTISETASAA